MNDFDTKLQTIAKVVSSIVAIITGVIFLWKKTMRPLLLFFCFQILPVGVLLFIPTGIILWFFFNLAMKNSHRLDEQAIFLRLVIQSVFWVSLYAFIWGRWLDPWFRPLLQKQYLRF